MLLFTALKKPLITIYYLLFTIYCLYAGDIRREPKIIGDGSELTSIPSNVSVSTINAVATAPYGGVNVTTNVFVAGNLGVGTVLPTTKLEVIQVDTAQSYIIKVGTTTTSYIMVVSTSGNIGIGTIPTTSKLCIKDLPVYNNNTAAKNGGLMEGAIYRTPSNGAVMVVY